MSLPEQTIGAKELVEALRQFVPLIPDYTHLSNDQIYALRRAATLDPEWVQEAVNAIGASPTVERAVGDTYEDLREEIADISRWTDVEQQLYAMLKGVRAANLVRRHRIGLKALQAYGIIRQLIRQPEHRDLLTHFEKLKQMNKLGKRKKKEEDEPEPEASSSAV